jgi:RNA polymerase sigma-70 factor, ECF subfamily
MKVVEMDDKDLVLSMSKGSEAAFTKLFHRHYKKLYLFSLKMLKSGDSAKEIVQNTFVRIWNTKERLDAVIHFESYLITIAKNMIIDHLRKVATEKEHMKNVGQLQPLFSNHTEELVDYNELQEISTEIVDSMPDKQRAIFKLSRDEGLSHDQIALKMGISINTVKVHIYNSLKYIRKNIEGNSYT